MGMPTFAGTNRYISAPARSYGAGECEISVKNAKSFA